MQSTNERENRKYVNIDDTHKQESSSHCQLAYDAKTQWICKVKLDK